VKLQFLKNQTATLLGPILKKKNVMADYS
jgi:hypothetical protein